MTEESDMENENQAAILTDLESVTNRYEGSAQMIVEQRGISGAGTHRLSRSQG